jgi:hypothetical protein
MPVPDPLELLVSDVGGYASDKNRFDGAGQFRRLDSGGPSVGREFGHSIARKIG